LTTLSNAVNSQPPNVFDLLILSSVLQKIPPLKENRRYFFLAEVYGLFLI
jgi:hypothetical protein